MGIILKDGVVVNEISASAPWEAPTCVKLPKEESAAWLAQQQEAEIARIKAEREARFRVETDDLHWKALELEKAGQDASAAWKDWLAAKEAVRKELPYPEEK